jgi:hypothetical protein
MNKTKAIKTARNRVGEIYAWGGQYRFNTWDESVNCWRESNPESYFNAQFRQSQELICETLRLMGYDEDQCYLGMSHYVNGEWTDHFNDMIEKFGEPVVFA